jgi:phospholipase C
MTTHLDRVNHIVVLMLENRSFDNMAGFLYDSANAPPFDSVPRSQPFEGVSGKNLSNPIPGGGTAPVVRTDLLTGPDPDPGEEFEHVNTQLYGTNPPPAPLPSPAAMAGFVTDYANAIQAYNHNHPLNPSPTQPASIMGCFTPDNVPVLSGLANQYAICDHWYSSVPSQTWSNRSFAHAATSSGRVNNCNPGSNIPVPNNTRTIFNVMEQAGLPWKIYYDGEDVLSLSLLAQEQLQPYHATRFSYMNQFWADAAAPNGLPAYAFIEPRFLLDHNDQHPGGALTESVANGEQLILDVYQAIRNGPNWQDTLLIITYDEHGGGYDHVPPPAAPPPDMTSPPGEQGFGFDRYGVRVCTVLVSPLIEPGTVFRARPMSPGPGPQPDFLPLDHTSIIKTITTRWGLPSLTNRDAQAADISGALTVWPPRTDLPQFRAPKRLARAAVAPGAEPLSDFQQQFVAAAATRLVPFRGAPLLPATHLTVGDAAVFLKARAAAFPKVH